MTAGSGEGKEPADLFVADFYPRLGEYLAAQHGAGYDAAPGRARFRAWLGEHAEADDADPVREYLKQVSKVPGLTAEQEAELAKRIEAGLAAERKLAEGGDRLAASERIDLEWVAEVGTRARNHLLEANLRLVVAVAKRFAGRGMPFLDLIQEGNLGLIRAVEHFDYTKGYRFATYATWWIRQAITRALADQPPTVQPPAGRGGERAAGGRGRRRPRRPLPGPGPAEGRRGRHGLRARRAAGRAAAGLPAARRRAGRAGPRAVPAAGSLALFQATCGDASTRLTVVSERLRVLNEQRRTGSGDPYAPATLSTSVNRQTLREVLAAGLDGRLVFGCELTSYEAARTASGCISPTDGRPRRTCWPARTASARRCAASTCPPPRRPIPASGASTARPRSAPRRRTGCRPRCGTASPR